MDEKFMALMNALQQHLESEKVFIKNPERMAEVTAAVNAATSLFPDAKVELADDPLQMGALILRIDGYDLVVRGQDEIDLFAAIIANADNFEIFATEDGGIRMSLVFCRALMRI